MLETIWESSRRNSVSNIRRQHSHQFFKSLTNSILVSSDFIKRIKAAKIPVAVLAGVAGLLFFLFGVRELTKYLQQLGNIIKPNNL